MGEVQAENLAGGDWARCGSPPMTPVFIQPNSLMSNGNASELLSATSCPSLSPSPSPYPRSVISEQDFDFCDPHNLTVGSGASPNPPAIKTSACTEFPSLPTLCAGDDEEHRYMLGGETFNKAAEIHARTFNFSTPTSHHGLPTFDQFSDLDSEEDFVNALVPARTSSPLTTSLSSARTTSKTSRNSRIPSNSRPLASQAHLHQAARPRSRRRSETRRPRRSTATRTAPNSTTLSDHESTLCQ